MPTCGEPACCEGTAVPCTAVDKLTVPGSTLDVKGTVTLGGNDGDQLTIAVSDANHVDGVFTWGGQLKLVGDVDKNAFTTMLITNGGEVKPEDGASGALFLSGGAALKVSNLDSQLTAKQTSLTDHSSLEVADNARVLLDRLTVADSTITVGSGGSMDVVHGFESSFFADEFLVSAIAGTTDAAVTAVKRRLSRQRRYPTMRSSKTRAAPEIQATT